MRLLGQEGSGPQGRPGGFWVGNTGLLRPGVATAANNTPLHGRVIGMTTVPTPLGLRDEEATRMGPPGVAMGAEHHQMLEGRPHEKQGMGWGMWEA